MQKSGFTYHQAPQKLQSEQRDTNCQVNSMGDPEASNDAILQTSLSQDVRSEKCIDTLTESDQNSACSNQQQHKVNLYLSVGNSVPNFAECPLVPRSPSTNVQLDMNDLKNRDQDIFSNEKLPFNDSSSNVSYASITSIPITQDSNNFAQAKVEEQLNHNSSHQAHLSDKVPTQQNQSKQNNQSRSSNPHPSGRKIPKIPDIFSNTKQNGNNGYNKNDKLSYSWPKKKNQKSAHLIQSSQYRTNVSSTNRTNKKKDVGPLRKS